MWGSSTYANLWRRAGDKGSFKYIDCVDLISFTIISEDGVVNISTIGEEFERACHTKLTVIAALQRELIIVDIFVSIYLAS